MRDPVAFLATTLAAAQREAERAAVETGAPGWRGSDSGLYSDDASNHPGPFLADAYGYTAPEVVAHIVRHDPQATLRRIAADRKTLALHQTPGRMYEYAGAPPRETAICRVCRYQEPMSEDPCETVRLLAEGWGWTEETT
jgi:hypothetical protein